MTYPNTPGFRDLETSRQSAEKIATHAATVRDKVATLYKHGYVGTPDKIAAALGISILTVRPRVTELIKRGLLIDTGARQKNESGHSAKVYRWAAPVAAERTVEPNRAA